MAEIPQNLPRSGVVKFVGREQKLRDLHEQLQKNDRIAITAISGMGGIGKTELALQYAIAQFQADSYSGGICWLKARDQEIATQITSFAQENLGLTLPELKIDGQIRYCWQQWPVGEVLIAIDNVTSYEAVAPYLPPSDPRFKLLITTRLNLGRSVESFSIEELDEESAMTMLKGIVKGDRIQTQLADAKVLCKWLGYLPLGLELVRRYLDDDPDLSVKALLEDLEETRLEAEALQAVEAGMTAELSVIQALELSWRELTELEQDLACSLGMFAAAPIPWGLVEKCFSDIDGKALKKARKNGLLHRSLLKRVGNDLYELHQIVQEFFRMKLHQQAERGDAIKSSFCQAFVEMSQIIVDSLSLTLAQVNDMRENIVHLEELGRYWSDSLSDDNLVWPFKGLGWFYREQGSYGLALSWYKICLKKAKDRFGDTHPHVAASLNNLASLYLIQGEYESAEPPCLEALTMTKQLLGNVNQDVATILNNLSEIYRVQGKYEAAEPLCIKALEMTKQLLGGTHLHVARSLNNLAGIYYAQKKYKAAEPLYVEALEMTKQLLGDTHLYVSISLNSLATLYTAQKKLEAAESLHLKTLAMRKQLFGGDSPYVATSLDNLAALYSVQEKYKASELVTTQD